MIKIKNSIVIALIIVIVMILLSLCVLQRNIFRNQKTIDNLEHFIESDDIPSYFKDKKISKGCCPSTYSTDRGCVCLDDKDKNQIYSRGNHYPNAL